jgi:citrate synthase
MGEKSKYFEALGEQARTNNRLQPGCFNRFGVKHGLRNEDGTGVLVGLTTISAVFGYDNDDGKVKPVEGRLYYRGVNLEDIVQRIEDQNRFGFEETIYLILFGNFPTSEELTRFRETLAEMRPLPMGFARDALQTCPTPNIMNGLARFILTLYSADPDPENLSFENQVRQAMEVVARMATLVPYAYHVIQYNRNNESLVFHKPDPALSAAENFLGLLRKDGEYTELEARTMDICLVLHADHGGGNNSTFTTRVVSSTLNDIYSSIAAAIGSLKGLLHGGANGRVVDMMDDIKKDIGGPITREAVRNYLFRLIQGEAFDGHGKVYGIGHAVYTLSDPRAVILKRYAERIAKEKGLEGDLELWQMVEEEAPKILREIKRDDSIAISPNVDFYSGFVYEAMGIPREVFTPIFAMGRMPGWCAHRLEMMSNPMKVVRPGFKAVCKHCNPEHHRCDTCIYSVKAF